MRVNPKVDIYSPEEKEILLFDDGIQVKSQKAQRQPKPRQGKNEQNPLKPRTPAITTDIVILQKAKEVDLNTSLPPSMLLVKTC